MKNLLGCVKDYLKGKPLQTFAAIGAKSLVKAIDFLGKASKIGSIVDRIGGLAGLPVPPTFFHAMFTSPMDSLLIRVGDPFSSKVITVNGTAVDDGADMEPPVIVEIGSQVIVTGKRFLLLGEAAPGIYLYDELGCGKPADELEVTGGAGSSDEVQTAKFKVPKGLAGKLRIVIYKGASQFVKPIQMEIKPKITGVFPKYLFKNEPLQQLKTDQPGIRNVKVTGNVKIRITTPEGTSNEFTFMLKDEPIPTEYRYLLPGDGSSVLTLEQAFQFANGESQPEGQFYNTCHWHSCDGPPPIPQCWYHPVYTNSKVSPNDFNPNDPTVYIWNYENFVTVPPGRTGTEKCPSYTNALPSCWEGLSAQEIDDWIIPNNENNNFAEPPLDELC